LSDEIAALRKAKRGIIKAYLLARLDRAFEKGQRRPVDNHYVMIL
jgi:hypothetical protein